jgi:hypothetical protein
MVDEPRLRDEPDGGGPRPLEPRAFFYTGTRGGDPRAEAPHGPPIPPRVAEGFAHTLYSRYSNELRIPPPQSTSDK